MPLLTTMAQVTPKAVSRQTQATAQTSLPRTLISIAALSVNVAKEPHLGKNNRVTLEVLQQAVELTKPWIEVVLEDVVQHVPSLASRDNHAATIRTRTRSFQDRGRLGTLLTLLSQFWKVSRLVKSGDSVPRRARVIRRLYAALWAEIVSAEEEIERLKALLLEGKRSGAERHRRRRRKGTEGIGSEDEWEDVAAAEDGDEVPVGVGGDGGANDTVLAGRVRPVETAPVESDEASQKWSPAREGGDDDRAKNAVLAGRVVPVVTGPVKADEAPQDPPKSQSKTSKSPASSQKPGKPSPRAAASESIGTAKAEQRDESVQAGLSLKASNEDGKPAKHQSLAKSKHQSLEKSRSASKIGADSKLSNIGPGKAEEGSRKSSAKSPRESPNSHAVKNRGICSPETSRSGLVSTSHEQSARVKEAAFSKASSLSPQRGRRTSPKDLNKAYVAGETSPGCSEAVATKDAPNQMVVGTISPGDDAKPTISSSGTVLPHRSSSAGSEVASALVAGDAVPSIQEEHTNLKLHNNVKEATSKATSRASKASRSKRSPDSATSHRSSSPRSEAASPLVTGDAVAGVQEEHTDLVLDDNFLEARSKATSRASKASRSKGSRTSAGKEANAFAQSETGTPAALPLSCPSETSSKSRGGSVGEGNSSPPPNARSASPSPAGTSSKNGSIVQRSAVNAMGSCSPKRSPSCSPIRPWRGDRGDGHAIKGAKRTESVTSTPSSCCRRGRAPSRQCGSPKLQIEVDIDRLRSAGYGHVSIRLT